jgi:hypothetical protein
MTGPELPDLVYRVTAIFLFALGIGMVAVHTTLAAAATQRTAQRPRTVILVSGAVGAYLALWLGLALVLGDRANFPLHDEASRLLFSLLVGFGPMVLAMAILFGSRAVRQLNSAMPSHWLIWAQTYRMAGLMFLFPFLYYGVVPASFAVPAAVGDFVTGALAPLVGLAVLRQRPNAIRWAIAWNFFGILDLLVAPASAVLSGAQVLGLFPLSLVPLFIGPPLGLLTHVYSLRNLALSSSAAASASPSPDDRTDAAIGAAFRTT